MKSTGDCCSVSGTSQVGQIWLQLGYNLSDTTAEWLRSGESPATLEIRSAAEELVRNMTAAKPQSRVHQAGAEFLRALVAPCLEEGAWALSARCGVAGEEVSLEEDAGKCQARCARTLGCAAFAFWSPGGQCHLQGHLTLLAKPETPQTPGWVSGPAACNISTLSRETRLLAQRHEDCYAPHALYQPLLEDVEPREMASALHCQQWCEEISSCAHFSFFTPTRLCHLSDAQATKLQPVLNFVAGPKSCTEFAALADLQFYQPEKGSETGVFQPHCGREWALMVPIPVKAHARPPPECLDGRTWKAGQAAFDYENGRPKSAASQMSLWGDDDYKAYTVKRWSGRWTRRKMNPLTFKKDFQSDALNSTIYNLRAAGLERSRAAESGRPIVSGPALYSMDDAGGFDNYILRTPPQMMPVPPDKPRERNGKRAFHSRLLRIAEHSPTCDEEELAKPRPSLQLLVAQRSASKRTNRLSEAIHWAQGKLGHDPEDQL
ncbi:unnamed protein product [Effrenium voratum]|nr:unnamed protein product [Effrenium voratum]